MVSDLGEILKSRYITWWNAEIRLHPQSGFALREFIWTLEKFQYNILEMTFPWSTGGMNNCTTLIYKTLRDWPCVGWI